MKPLFTSLFLLCSISLFGQQEPATIYIFRAVTKKTNHLNVKVKANGKKIGKLNNGQKMIYTTYQDTVQLLVSHQFTPIEEVQKQKYSHNLFTEPGATYYLTVYLNVAYYNFGTAMNQALASGYSNNPKNPKQVNANIPISLVLLDEKQGLRTLNNKSLFKKKHADIKVTDP